MKDPKTINRDERRVSLCLSKMRGGMDEYLLWGWGGGGGDFSTIKVLIL